jgi:hypothetical protein
MWGSQRRYLPCLRGEPEARRLRAHPTGGRSRRRPVGLRGCGQGAGPSPEARSRTVCCLPTRGRDATRCCHSRRPVGDRHLGAGEALRHQEARLRPRRAPGRRGVGRSRCAVPRAPGPPADPPRPGRFGRGRSASQPCRCLPSFLQPTSDPPRRRPDHDGGHRRGLRTGLASGWCGERRPAGGLSGLNGGRGPRGPRRWPESTSPARPQGSFKYLGTYA